MNDTTQLNALRIAAIEMDQRETGIYVNLTVLDGEDRELIEKIRIKHDELEAWLSDEGYLNGEETLHDVIAGKDTTTYHKWDHWYFDFIRLHLTVDILYDYLIAKKLTMLEFIEE